MITILGSGGPQSLCGCLELSFSDSEHEGKDQPALIPDELASCSSWTELRSYTSTSSRVVILGWYVLSLACARYEMRSSALAPGIIQLVLLRMLLSPYTQSCVVRIIKLVEITNHYDAVCYSELMASN